MARAGAYQMDQGMLEGGIVLQQGVILRPVVLYYECLVLREHIVQKRFFLLDLPDQEDHGVIIRGHDVA